MVLYMHELQKCMKDRDRYKRENSTCEQEKYRAQVVATVLTAGLALLILIIIVRSHLTRRYATRELDVLGEVERAQQRNDIIRPSIFELDTPPPYSATSDHTTEDNPPSYLEAVREQSEESRCNPNPANHQTEPSTVVSCEETQQVIGNRTSTTSFANTIVNERGDIRSRRSYSM